jgi:tetratricopeptide (TPR) repeat protein
MFEEFGINENEILNKTININIIKFYKNIFEDPKCIMIICSDVNDLNYLSLNFESNILDEKLLLLDKLHPSEINTLKFEAALSGVYHAIPILSDVVARAYNLHSNGENTKAIDLLQKARLGQPPDFDLFRLLGLLLFLEGDRFAGVKWLKEAFILNSEHIPTLTNLGKFSLLMDNCIEAIEYFKRIIIIDPESHEAYFECANALQKSNDFYSALKYYQSVSIHFKQNVPFLNNYGQLCGKLNKLDDAISLFENAISIDPENAVISNNIAVICLMKNDLERAKFYFNQSMALDPEYVEPINNLGNIFFQERDYSKALSYYDKAINIKSNYFESYWNKSLLLLTYGDYINGFSLFEVRFLKPSFQPIVRNFNQPMIDLNVDLGSTTVLLYAEQGLGDTLQFVRYVEMVKALGARIVLEVQASLFPLFDGLFAVETLVKQGDPLPPFDYHCPLMSLPLAFQTTLSSIPSGIPYIKPSSKKERFWAEKLGPNSQLIVGLVWSGDPRHQNDKLRSIGLDELLAALPPRFSYVSLQSEIRDSDRQALDDCDRLVHFGPELKDFSDTAALCAQMDVVVCVDTSVAHLSGALGKPTFLLLSYNPDWRWLLERTDSPWYPTMKLFRQAQLGSWRSALEKVSADLLGLEQRRFTK